MFDPTNLCYSVGKYYINNPDLIEYILFKNAFDYFKTALIIAYTSLILNTLFIKILKYPVYFDIKKDVFLYKKRFRIIQKEKIYPFYLIYEILLISLEFQIIATIGVLISAKAKGLI